MALNKMVLTALYTDKVNRLFRTKCTINKNPDRCAMKILNDVTRTVFVIFLMLLGYVYYVENSISWRLPNKNSL